jgi:hypothetical protein
MSYTIGGTPYSWNVSGILTPANVIAIPNYANITNIVLPVSVIEIADYTFYSSTTSMAVCPLLVSITMPGVITIGKSAFARNGGMPSGSLVSVNAPEVTTISDSAFLMCSKLTTIIMPKVITIGIGAFTSCSKLVISEINATIIQNSAFSSCSALINVNLPKWTNYYINSKFNWSNWR